MNFKLIHPRWLTVSLVSAGILTLSSCNDTRFENASRTPSDSKDAAVIPRDAAIANMPVMGDEKMLATWLAKSHGNVVLIDYWATWCGPCVQQFSHTVELANQHKEEGLRVFAVSMDEPDDRQIVSDFLHRRNADFETLLTRYGIGAEFANAFDIRGDIPFYRLYDRKGQLRYSFSADPEGIENCEVIEKIDERVKELLAEGL